MLNWIVIALQTTIVASRKNVEKMITDVQCTPNVKYNLIASLILQVNFFSVIGAVFVIVAILLVIIAPCAICGLCIL